MNGGPHRCSFCSNPQFLVPALRMSARNKILNFILLCEYTPSCYIFKHLEQQPCSSLWLRQSIPLLMDITIDNLVTNHLIPLVSLYPRASHGNIISTPICERLSRVMMQWNSGRFLKLIKWAPQRAISRHHWSMFKVSESWWWPQQLCKESTAENLNQTLTHICWLILVTVDAWTPVMAVWLFSEG